jgi:hypothetical protein
MAKDRFERNAAKCVRLAKGAGDAVLSYGFLKMAAWRDLAKRRDSPTRQHTRRRSTTHRRHSAPA